jgi:3'-phosphoadenosine 5'-phosphosulfate sulfotransferase (PAPS reductase)/FAD synthetase
MKNDQNNIVSLSGGKDSTAMLLMMLELGEPVHSAIFFDTGWEFPEMYPHLDLVARKTGVKIVCLKPARPFHYWLYERPVVAAKGPNKGEVHRIGNGWPSPLRRWCTREKTHAIRRYLKTVPNSVSCIGFAADEGHRATGSANLQAVNGATRFPLIEWGVTETDALQYCLARGYKWGGLYDVFHRVSCFCCPLQRLSELRKLRKHYPKLWARMLKMDEAIPDHNRGFKGYKTVRDLENRFAEEDRQGDLFPEMDAV